MSETRRAFLQSAALAGLAAGATPAASEIQVPTMKFGGVDIGRLVAGCNPFYGFAHYNNILAAVMKDYYTPERICEVLHECNRFGINAYNWVDVPRARQDLQRFGDQGGRMHLIVQGMGDVTELCKTIKPLAIYHHGERTDTAWQSGQFQSVKEWCKRTRDLGVLVGVGTHKPEVLARVEEEAWDVDFYAGCVYNRTRTADEWKRVLNNEVLEMQGEIYLRSDPPRMYNVMRQTAKPCFAFKIMAAGRIDERGADLAFRTAFESIKPIDGIFIGLFPRVRDEVRENAERVHRILVAS